MSVVPDYLQRQVVEGEREPDLLVPERLLCTVDAIDEQMSVKRRLVEILKRQEEDS
jgi:hypothetical protein